MNDNPVECSILPMKFRMDGALAAATNRYLTGCHATYPWKMCSSWGACMARGHGCFGFTMILEFSIGLNRG
jgi:hypothetical protein